MTHALEWVPPREKRNNRDRKQSAQNRFFRRVRAKISNKCFNNVLANFCCIFIVRQAGARIKDDDVIYERPAPEMMSLGSTKSRLVIDCVSRDDVGEYTCVAETPSQKIRSTTFLQIGESDAPMRSL